MTISSSERAGEAGRTWQDDANEHWRGVVAEFASGKRKFTVIQPQLLAHERIPVLEAEIARLHADLSAKDGR